MDIQAYRVKKKYTQKTASEKLGITKEYLSAIERGERNPSDKLKKKMAGLYGITIIEIFLALEETHSFKK